MNVRFVNCFVAVIGLVCLGVNGDVTPLPPDPPIAAAAQSALNMAPFGDELAKVGPEVDKLVQNSTDPATVSMVRNWLIDQDPPAATNPYQVAYSAALNDAFVNALSQPNVPINAKINIAIVIKSLAGPKTNLAPTVVKLLAEPNAAVAQWGVKAAGAMLPGALEDANFNAGGQRDQVLNGIVSAVSNHPDGLLAGPIAEDGYRAINPKLWVGPTPTGAALAALIDANLDLQGNRLTIYRNIGVPAFPVGDSYPSYLFFTPIAWPAMSPAQQVKAVQQASDFVSLAGQRYSSAAPTMNLNQELIAALKGEGEWITKLGGILNDQQIQQVGTDLNQLSTGAPALTVQQVSGSVFGALQNNPAFTNLQQCAPLGAPPAVVPKSASDTSGGSSPTSEARQ